MEWHKLIGKTITDASYDEASRTFVMTIDGEVEIRVSPKMELTKGTGSHYAPALSFERSDVVNVPL